mmetsp:Transcript_17698/g.27317  ORF Transcript_17698/g.27317 Transcript_17698/m.27317 type:complete len:80 (+) Transcript_17698:978-1217(+)
MKVDDRTHEEPKVSVVVWREGSLLSTGVTRRGVPPWGILKKTWQYNTPVGSLDAQVLQVFGGGAQSENGAKGCSERGIQ